MHKLNSIGLTIILAVLTLPTTASAESWICESGNVIREINVQRETDNPAPCSVVYDKSAEGLGANAVWTAQFDGAYCDAKANGLAEKLSGLGWSCTEF